MKQLLILLLICLPLILFSQKQKGIALVIGNEFSRGHILKNPINDANLIKETLQNLGHEVVIHYNIATKSEMLEILKDFKSTGKGYDVVFIYYAGDGAQIYNANFLFPTDYFFESEKDVFINSISAQYILNYLKGMTDNLMIMMLDVNRNNPFKKSIGFMGESKVQIKKRKRKRIKGKKFMKHLDTLQPPNSLISFSTSSRKMSSHYYIRDEGGYLALEGSFEEYEKSLLDLYEKGLLEKNIIRDANIFYVKEDGVRLFRDSLSVTVPNPLRGNVRHTLLEGQEVVLLSDIPLVNWNSWFWTTNDNTVYIRSEDIKNSRSSQGWISHESLIPYPLTFLTSDYSKILSKNIILWHNNSNLSISEAFKNVRSEMRTITHNQQISTISSNLSSKDIFFIEDSDDQFSDRGLILLDDKQKDNSISIDSSEYYALIIGVQDYENDNFPRLTHPINDAQKLYNTLVNNYTFKENNIIFLKNPTKEEIEKEFDNLSDSLNEDDNLLIFYAGHGGKWNRKNIKDGYWSPSNAVFEKSSTLISNNTIKDYLKLISARNILLISDACWASSILRDRGIKDNAYNKEVIQELYSIPSRYYMSSGQNTTVPDESIFIKFLIEALEDNQNLYLRASDLFSRINKPILNNVPRSDGNIVIPELSQIAIDGHFGGDFIFIRKFQ